MKELLAKLQNKRAQYIRRMLANRVQGFSYAGHPWSNAVRSLHDESAFARKHNA